jgi:ADP-ribosyl-[dinitrogen reductase] hydrolase
MQWRRRSGERLDWHNGAYVRESLPCALWCFLASPEDFEQTLFAAVDAGHDADTVAAMACSVAGGYHGYARLPERLVRELEYRDRLIELADGLYELNRRLADMPSGPAAAVMVCRRGLLF